MSLQSEILHSLKQARKELAEAKDPSTIEMLKYRVLALKVTFSLSL